MVTAIEVDTAESGQSFSDSRGSGCVENCKKKSRRLYFNAGHGGRRVFLDAEKPLVEDRHLARDFVFTKTKKKMFFLFRRSVKSIICSNFLELLDDYLRADKRSFEKKNPGRAGHTADLLYLLLAFFASHVLRDEPRSAAMRLFL